jgi:hypothetical protein
MRKPIIGNRKSKEIKIEFVAESFPETLNACGELVRPGNPRHGSMNQE